MSKIKDYKTCFYYNNPSEADKPRPDVSDECFCLDTVMCQDCPGKQCSFYLPKQDYKWGVSKTGSPMPITNKGRNGKKDNELYSTNGKRYGKRIPVGLKV